MRQTEHLFSDIGENRNEKLRRIINTSQCNRPAEKKPRGDFVDKIIHDQWRVSCLHFKTNDR